MCLYFMNGPLWNRIWKYENRQQYFDYFSDFIHQFCFRLCRNHEKINSIFFTECLLTIPRPHSAVVAIVLRDGNEHYSHRVWSCEVLIWTHQLKLHRICIFYCFFELYENEYSTFCPRLLQLHFVWIVCILDYWSYCLLP